MRAPRSLFWTIAGMFLLTVVVGTLAQALLAVAVLRPLEAREKRARAELAASTIATELTAAPELASGPGLDTLLARQRAKLGDRPPWILCRLRDGAVVTAPPGRDRVLARLDEADSISGARREGSRPGGSGGRFEVLARQAIASGSNRGAEILVVAPVWPRGGLDLFGSRSLLFLPIAMIASAIAGLVMVRLLVRRLRALETLAARVAEGNLSVRIADRSGDEIGRLAERLDRMTERLDEARIQLETTDRQRRQLFADITHELATPLTSIRGYAETLLDPSVPVSTDERARYVRGVLDEARRLDRLTRDLFELSRLEAGAAPLAKERLDWVALCRNTIQRFEPRFRDAGLSLRWRGPLEEAWIEADGYRIEQVLDNVLVNALRYVPAGGTVDLSLERVSEHGDRVRLTVSDDGPGLPAEELPLVFERFYRGAATRGAGAANGASSGLGLAIVRQIVEHHGGTVRAESRPGRGLSIVIELP